MSRFTDILKYAGETIQQVAPGLSWSNVVSDVKAEAKRLLVQGAAESASLVFQGHAYVPYGPGQNKTAAEKALEPPEQPAIESPEHEQSHGRSM
jgi:hypothetical protein